MDTEIKMPITIVRSSTMVCFTLVFILAFATSL
jgi:hypothetical protein